ncbi:MAG: DUF4188 domain-containing protein [Herpetosiphonaceae bacterium]|nr:DUF4188 domain-containing protein [Herpetosiphonaceae bacterium]
MGRTTLLSAAFAAAAVVGSAVAYGRRRKDGSEGTTGTEQSVGSAVVAGRFTAKIEGPFVVFIIGMRINRLLAFRRWVPTFLAMPPMLKELEAHPETGYLGGHIWLSSRSPVLIQYWRSFEDLDRFARDPHQTHLPAWRRFNRSVGTDGSVGVWHETFLVGANQYETIYVNMPIQGLAASSTHVAIGGRQETAARRLGFENEPAVASPEASLP